MVRRPSIRVVAFVAIFVLAPLLAAYHLFRRSTLPPDREAVAYFKNHRKDFDAIASILEKNRAITFCATYETDVSISGPEASRLRWDCMKWLWRSGAKSFVNDRDGGCVQITVWGFGCAICADDWEGFDFFEPTSSVLRYAAILPSLEDKAIPHGRRGGLEPGLYLKPLGGGWYIFRIEGS
ncbi:hypothetical protein GALL_276180 [mine drainage metagenome]|uniref:Uncharacterized protein n=1 Tax=mine drainage metagenome TaxID=410659 RepID=A0A1J5REQ3_9ZZZZ